VLTARSRLGHERRCCVRQGAGAGGQGSRSASRAVGRWPGAGEAKRGAALTAATSAHERDGSPRPTYTPASPHRGTGRAEQHRRGRRRQHEDLHEDGSCGASVSVISRSERLEAPLQRTARVAPSLSGATAAYDRSPTGSHRHGADKRRRVERAGLCVAVHDGDPNGRTRRLLRPPSRPADVLLAPALGVCRRLLLTTSRGSR